MIKGSIHQEDITFVNIYIPNMGAPEHIKQILTDLKKEIDSNTIIVGDFITPFSKMHRLSSKKINKEILDTHYMLYHTDLTDIYGMFHPTAAYTFLSRAHSAG